MTNYEYNYDYLNNYSDEQLVELVKEMADFEEVSEAFLIIDERNSELAFKLGKDIYVNNKADDYLQATVWDAMYYACSKKAIEILTERDIPLGKVLFGDIVNNLNVFKDEINEKVIDFLKKSYDSYSNDIQNNLKEGFKELLVSNKN